jgi:hypothetical protein
MNNAIQIHLYLNCKPSRFPNIYKHSGRFETYHQFPNIYKHGRLGIYHQSDSWILLDSCKQTIYIKTDYLNDIVMLNMRLKNLFASKSKFLVIQYVGPKFHLINNEYGTCLQLGSVRFKQINGSYETYLKLPNNIALHNFEDWLVMFSALALDCSEPVINALLRNKTTET